VGDDDNGIKGERRNDKQQAGDHETSGKRNDDKENEFVEQHKAAGKAYWCNHNAETNRSRCEVRRSRDGRQK